MAQQGPYHSVNHTFQAYYTQEQYPSPSLQTPQTLNLNPFSHPQFHHHQFPSIPQLQSLPLIHPQYSLHHHQASYAQNAQILGSITPPVQVHTHHEPHLQRSSNKRPREATVDFIATRETGDAGGDVPSPKRKKGQDVLFRIVVPSKQIGKVIGKQGFRIQKIREETKASIKIADAIARYEERVIIISSKENDGGVTDAEQALQQIAHLILQDDGTRVEPVKVSASITVAGGTASSVASGGTGAVHVPANAIRLLIAGSQAGGLIGVSGQNIEKLRNSSGANITVLAPNQLPYCASAHESDRLIQISGDVLAVLKALEEIGFLLRENPPKQVISISPAYNLSTNRAAQQYPDPTAADYITLDMVISETMIGGLIGRCGSNISRIRNESGAMIKVYGGKGEQKHRQIQLSGTAAQVALAKQRIDEYIYSELIQVGVHQSSMYLPPESSLLSGNVAGTWS